MWHKPRGSIPSLAAKVRGPEVMEHTYYLTNVYERETMNMPQP